MDICRPLRCTHEDFFTLHLDGLVQERCNSSVLAMELRLSCTNPSISFWINICALNMYEVWCMCQFGEYVCISDKFICTEHTMWSTWETCLPCKWIYLHQGFVINTVMYGEYWFYWHKACLMYKELKQCHFDKIFITGCTGSCHFDNFQCSQS